jgi:hypothetical protein
MQKCITIEPRKRGSDNGYFRAFSQIPWSEKSGEVWFSLRENHVKVRRFGLHQLRKCSSHPPRSGFGIEQSFDRQCWSS